MEKSMVEKANKIWADGPSSAPFQPFKPDIRDWGTWIESIIGAFFSTGGKIYQTRALLNADLTPAANSIAWVMEDPTVANNGIYRKVGGTGAGSWVRAGDLPFSFIVASNPGAGTPNAIQATTSMPVSSSALVILPVAATNTATPVTVAFNGGSALTVKSNSGNDIAAGGLVSGMILFGIVAGSSFRLVSDQVSAAVVAAAEAAQTAAEAAAASINQRIYTAVSNAVGSTIPAVVKRLQTQFYAPNYAVPGTLVGGATYRRASLTELTGYPALSYFRSVDRYLPDGTTNTTNGGYWLLDDATPNPYQFGAIGDNATDDAPELQAWGDFCGITRRGGYIPFGYYALGAQLVWTKPFDIESDESAILRWTVSGGGILGDFRSSPYGLNKWVLPGLLSSAINSSFNIPGYSSGAGWAYNVNTRNGSAVHIKGASRYTVEVQNIQGFENAYQAEATNDVTYGAHGVANVEFFVNTCDFTENLFYLNAGPSGAGGVVAFNLYANTAWVKRVLKANSQNGLVGGGGTITVGGQVFLNESGACAIYSIGANCSDFQIDLAWVSAGKASDSPSGTPSNLVCGYVSGDFSSNGLVTDGGTADGYFRGNGVRGKIGAVMGFPLPSAPFIGGFPIGTNGRVRIKNAGTNRFEISNQDMGTPGAIALSTTQGEGNFNGGIGGALLARRQLVSVAVPTLPNFGSATFYFYHQLLSVSRRVPISIIPIDSSIASSKLIFTALDRVADDAVNRQGKVEVINVSGGSITGATYFFWVDIG